VVSAKQENFIKSQYLYNVPVVIIVVVQQVGAVKIYVASYGGAQEKGKTG
jgi:hypothetical protein